MRALGQLLILTAEFHRLHWFIHDPTHPVWKSRRQRFLQYEFKV